MRIAVVMKVIRCCVGAIALGLSSALALEARGEDPPVKREDGAVEGLAWVRCTTQDRLSREITFYMTEASLKDEKRPLVVYIQGSGGGSLFGKRGERLAGMMGQSTVAKVAGERAHVLVVEKPGVAFLSQASRPGGADGADRAFREEHTLERWSEAVSAAVRGAAGLACVDRSRVLVAGHSEGGLVACRVGASNPGLVTHCAALAGGGPTQLFDLIELVRRGDFYQVPDASNEKRLELFLGEWRVVLADPMSAEKSFLGHPYRRWTTFLASSPLEELQRFDGAVFIGQGMADTAVLPASADVLYAQLLSRGKRVAYERVEGADHSFNSKGPDGKPVEGWTSIWSKVMDWFLGGGESTEAAGESRVP